jgi:MFS family permease
VASPSRFHLRAVLVSGWGFFTDAYDLSVIGIASTLITKDWNLSSGRLALLNSTMLFAAFLGVWLVAWPERPAVAPRQSARCPRQTP